MRSRVSEAKRMIEIDYYRSTKLNVIPSERLFFRDSVSRVYTEAPFTTAIIGLWAGKMTWILDPRQSNGIK